LPRSPHLRPPVNKLWASFFTPTRRIEQLAATNGHHLIIYSTSADKARGSWGSKMRAMRFSGPAPSFVCASIYDTQGQEHLCNWKTVMCYKWYQSQMLLATPSARALFCSETFWQKKIPRWPPFWSQSHRTMKVLCKQAAKALRITQSHFTRTFVYFCLQKFMSYDRDDRKRWLRIIWPLRPRAVVILSTCFCELKYNSLIKRLHNMMYLFKFLASE